MGFKSIELKTDSHQTRKLEGLEIGFTSRCNFNCDYCGAYNRDEKESILSAGQVIDLIKDLPDLKRIKLSGGEVTLLFEDCLRIVKFCSSRGIESQINTNGSVLNARKIKLLDEAGLNYLHFSLNHTDGQAHHNYYKRGEKTFHRIVENIKYAVASSSIDTIIEIIIFEETLDHFVELYHFTYGLGVRKLQIQAPVQQSHWKTSLSPEKLKEAIETLLTVKKPDSEFYFTCLEIDPSSHFYKKIQKLIDQGGVYFPYCIEGKNQLHLHSNGDILICDIGNPVVLGNALKGESLKDILANRAGELDVLADNCKCLNYLD